MEFRERRALAIAAADQAGVPRGQSEPWLYRAVWSVGLRVPPPHFAGPGANLAVLGAWWGAVWVTIGLFSTGWALQPSLVLWAFVGLANAGIQAAYIENNARRHDLPTWDKVGSERLEPVRT